VLHPVGPEGDLGGVDDHLRVRAKIGSRPQPRQFHAPRSDLYQAIGRIRRLTGGKARKADEGQQRNDAAPTTSGHDQSPFFEPGTPVRHSYLESTYWSHDPPAVLVWKDVSRIDCRRIRGPRVQIARISSLKNFFSLENR